MTDPEVDHTLQWAAQAPYEVDAAVVKRASDAILPSLRPVRPLPSAGVLTLVLGFICILVALVGSTILGSNGVRVLDGTESWLIFLSLSIATRLVASEGAAEMLPGSTRRIQLRILAAGCTLGYIVLFPILIHDFRLDRFASEGINCLGNGLFHAAVTGLALWLVLRMGVVFDPTSAGLAMGTLAGLTGFAVLELHCPILKTPHLMIWHTAVIPLSALAGYGVGKFVQDLGTKRKAAEFMQ